MQIIVHIADLEHRATSSRAVADYVVAMLKVRALKRAVTVALLQAEHRARRLSQTELDEAKGLLETRTVAGIPPAQQPSEVQS